MVLLVEKKAYFTELNPLILDIFYEFKIVFSGGLVPFMPYRYGHIQLKQTIIKKTM